LEKFAPTLTFWPIVTEDGSIERLPLTWVLPGDCAELGEPIKAVRRAAIVTSTTT
jgi:hypothetical protein